MRSDRQAERGGDCRLRLGVERAQAEYVGYVVIVSAIIVAIGVVTLFGTTALGEVQSATIADNGEFAMQALGADLEAIHYGTASVRNTEITLKSASLETGPPTIISVTAIRCEDSDGKISDDDGCGGDRIVVTNAHYTYRPIVYKTGDVTIVYSNTLTLRDQPRGAVAVSGPLFVLGEQRSVVPVIATNATIRSVSGGTHTVHSTFVNASGRTVTADPTKSGEFVAVNLTIQTRPDWMAVWGRAFNETLVGVPNPRDPPQCERLNDATISCDFRTERLVVSNTTIRYELR